MDNTNAAVAAKYAYLHKAIAAHPSRQKHTARCTIPTSVVSQCTPVCGWGLRKRRSAPPCGS